MATITLRLPKLAIVDLLEHKEALAAEGYVIGMPGDSTTDWASIKVEFPQEKKFHCTNVQLAMALGRIVGWQSKHL